MPTWTKTYVARKGNTKKMAMADQKNIRYDYGYLYIDADNAECEKGITSLFRRDGTVADKPEDYDKNQIYGPMNARYWPRGRKSNEGMTNVEFAAHVAKNRKGIIAEYERLVRKVARDKKIAERKHRIDERVIPFEPTIVLGSKAKKFTATIVFPNGTRLKVVFQDDGTIQRL